MVVTILTPAYTENTIDRMDRIAIGIVLRGSFTCNVNIQGQRSRSDPVESLIRTIFF